MTFNRLNGIADSDTQTQLPLPDSPVRNRQDPNAKDCYDLEVIIKRRARSRRQNRVLDVVNTPRTELNNLYDEMRQLRNEIFRVRNRTRRLDTQQRNHTDSSTD